MNNELLKQCRNEIALRYGYRSWKDVDFYALDAINEITSKPYSEEILTNQIIELYSSRQREEDRKRIELLESVLRKAQSDINWMLNNRTFLNPATFDIIESVLNP